MLTKTTLNDVLKPKIKEEKSFTKLEKKTTNLKNLLKRKELYKERQIKRENLKKEIQYK